MKHYESLLVLMIAAHSLIPNHIPELAAGMRKRASNAAPHTSTKVPLELVMLPGTASWLPTVVMNGVVDAYGSTCTMNESLVWGGERGKMVLQKL